MNIQEQIEYVKQKWDNIKNIDNPNEEVQLEAIKVYPWAIRYIKNPNKEVQLAVVKQDINTIYWIKNPFIEVQLKAVEQDICSIEYIKNPSEEVKHYIANNIDFNKLSIYAILIINIIQNKIKDAITKEIYYKSPKDFPWIPEIKERFKDIDRFKRFNL